MGGPPRLLDRCAVTRCRRVEAMRYMGKPLCWECLCRLTADTDSSDALCRALRIPLQKKSGPHGAGTLNPEPALESPQGARAGSLAAVGGRR